MKTVGEILDEKGAFVATAGPDSTVVDAARLMNDHRIGALVVIEKERIAGIFTERDILTKIVAPQVDPLSTKVRDVMTHPVACCRRNTTVSECYGVMTERHIRHLPVVDNEGKLIGIITSGDLVAREVVDQQATIEFLHEYIQAR